MLNDECATRQPVTKPAKTGENHEISITEAISGRIYPLWSGIC
jgi:hypothetical protein